MLRQMLVTYQVVDRVSCLWVFQAARVNDFDPEAVQVSITHGHLAGDDQQQQTGSSSSSSR
jgi:hypothetical protein